MTSKAGHTFTAGPWDYVAGSEHHGPYVAGPYGDICDCYAMSNPMAASVRNGGTSFPINHQGEAAEANARLIAEAGTVAHETGLTPRQLAEQINVVEVQRDLAETQRDELLAAVSSLDIPWLDHNVLSDELVVPIAVLGTSFRAEITIGQLRAIRAAIAKATAGGAV